MCSYQLIWKGRTRRYVAGIVYSFSSQFFCVFGLYLKCEVLDILCRYGQLIVICRHIIGGLSMISAMSWDEYILFGSSSSCNDLMCGSCVVWWSCTSWDMGKSLGYLHSFHEYVVKVITYSCSLETSDCLSCWCVMVAFLSFRLARFTLLWVLVPLRLKWKMDPSNKVLVCAKM